MAQKARTQTWGYDLFKGVVTLILVIMLVVLLLRCSGPTRTTAPTPVAQVTSSPTATSSPPTTAPTATPTAEPTPAPTATPEPTPAKEPSPTPEPAQAITPPALTLPDAGVRVGEWALEGTGTPGSRVRVTIDGQQAGEVEVGPDGKWSLTVAEIDAGEHEVQLDAIADGNVVVASEPVAVEVAAPAVAAPTVRLQAAGDELALEGTGTPGSRLQIVIDGQVTETVTVDEVGRWSAGVALAPGDHDVAVRAVDREGGIAAESEPSSWTQPERLVEPGPAWIFPAAGDALRAGPVELRGTGTPGAEIEILDGDVVLGTATVQEDGAWRFAYELSPGAHALSARYPGQEGSGGQPVSVVPVQESCPFVSVPPGESRCTADPPPGEDRGDTYVVARCETIRLIAARTGVSVQDLLAVNPQVCNPNLIYEGQVLTLPPRE